jgi:hypothetical protein
MFLFSLFCGTLDYITTEVPQVVNKFMTIRWENEIFLFLSVYVFVAV